MGRLIDADKLIEYWLTPPNNIGWDDEIECVNNQPTVDAISKNEYENRLKADLVAMLEEIKLEIEELDYFDGEELINITQELMDEVKNWEHGVKDCKKLIQGKINKLKGEEDGKID